MQLVLITFAAGGIGAGIIIFVRGLVPPARPLAVLTAELHQPRQTTLVPSARRWDRLASRLAGTPSVTFLADCAAAGIDPRRVQLDRLTGSSVFAGIVAVPLLVFPFTGVDVSAPASAIAVLAAGGCGWLYPGVDVRRRAVKARDAWMHALTTYVDLVGIGIAGGAGVDDAVLSAAELGAGPQLEQLAQVLREAATRRQKQAAALDELGVRLGLPALIELAASLELATTDGSRVRETLLAKAQSFRTRQLTDVEAAAQKASESMGVAPAVMAIAAVILIGYPAVARLLQ